MGYASLPETVTKELRKAVLALSRSGAFAGRTCVSAKPGFWRTKSAKLRERLVSSTTTMSITMWLMRILKILSKPAAWASGWTSAILCFSAAAGYLGAGEHRRAICWAVLGAVEISAIVL